MDQIVALLEREREFLETLLFKLVETRLILENGEVRFLSRATREVERARTRAREVDLMRATTVSRHAADATLRTLAAEAPEPWPTILRDHHDLLASLVAEIEVTGHRNAETAREAIGALAPGRVDAGGGGHETARGQDAELDRLAQGAALDTVLGTAARLRMPDLLAFLS
ncbi:hypothetical protein BH23ACT2_BH23ACT2_11510 [soil metagenome]